jgi:hypothetical protein
MSIRRRVFQQILILYPKPFREEFGKEMLETFQECLRSQSSWSLLMDAFLSAMRQQIHYRSVDGRKSAPPYPEIGVSLSLPRVMTGVAFGAVLMAGLWAPAERKPPQRSVSRASETVSPAESLREWYYLYSSMVGVRYAR